MRAFTVVLLILVVVLGAGAYFAWFHFSVTSDPQKRDVEFSMKIDKDKIKSDVAKARETASETADKITGAVREKKTDEPRKAESATGTIVAVHTDQNLIRLRTVNNDELTIQLQATSKVQINKAPGNPGQLQPGDRALVNYQVDGGRNIAELVIVDRTAAAPN